MSKVPAFGATRFSVCTRLMMGVFALLLAVASLQGFATAQNSAANSDVPALPQAGEAKPADSPSAEQSSPSEAASPSQIPTAAQVEATAPDKNSGDPELKTTAPAPNSAPQPAAPSRNGNSPLDAKYDVSMIGQRNVGSGLDFYSLDREIALGRQLSSEVEMSARLLSDPIINEYINRIGQNLVRNSDARVPFTIKILDTDEVNAFALPGGFFYVNTGLILAADNEAELAGVMAHEIAHVAARHATKNMTRAQIWNIASVPLIFIGGPVAYAISEVASLAVPLGFLKFSRDAEREADLLGLEYEYSAGYDPQCFVEFFEKLNVDGGKKKQSLVAKAFATHPMNADRIKAAQDEIRKYLPDRPEYTVDTSEFQGVKSRLLSLEHARRLGGAKGEANRPVLLKRTASSSGDPGTPSTQDGNGSPNQQDDGRPTLKRSPNSSSD